MTSLAPFNSSSGEFFVGSTAEATEALRQTSEAILAVINTTLTENRELLKKKVDVRLIVMVIVGVNLILWLLMLVLVLEVVVVAAEV